MDAELFDYVLIILGTMFIFCGIVAVLSIWSSRE